MAENFVVSLDPGLADKIAAEYQRRGALDVAHLNNISTVLQQDIWVVAMPDGFPEENMKIPGVLKIEGEIEHGFYQRVTDIGPQDFDPLPNLLRDAPLSRFDLKLGTPSDFQSFTEKGSLTSILESIQAPQAWEYSRGEGVTIVVIDSGVDGARVPPEKRSGGWTDGPGDPWVDAFGHGTMVALTSAANKRYNGFDGVAPEAKIYSMKPNVGPSGGILGTSVLKGLDYLMGLNLGPVVSNQSWGVFG